MTTYTRNWQIPRSELIILAIEYDMVHSTMRFEALNARAQDAILRTIGKLADAIDWTGCFERA